MKEVCLQLPSEAKRVTIGDSRRNTFMIAGDAVPDRFDLFRRAQFGYELQLLPGMEGSLTLNGEEQHFEGVRFKRRYVTPGDEGCIHYAGVSFFFQFVRPERRPPSQPLLRGFDKMLAGSLWVSLVIQLAVVLVALLAWTA